MKEKLTDKRYSDFEKEILPHTEALRSFALKMTNDPDESDDLVQETLLKSFRFFDKFQKGTNAKAWIFQIMKNSFINEFRKKSKTPLRVDYDDVNNFYESISADEVKTVHYKNDAFSDILDDQIADALSALPDEFRTIVFLSDIEGYTYEEIADFVDCPVGTVRSRLHRARKMLYSLLVNYAEEHGFLTSSADKTGGKINKMVKKELINHDFELKFRSN